MVIQIKENDMKNGINVRIVEQEDGFIVRARVNSKKVELRPASTARTGFVESYAHVDSAQRAWRKYATAKRISNYTYELV